MGNSVHIDRCIGNVFRLNLKARLRTSGSHIFRNIFTGSKVTNKDIKKMSIFIRFYGSFIHIADVHWNRSFPIFNLICLIEQEMSLLRLRSLSFFLWLCQIDKNRRLKWYLSVEIASYTSSAFRKPSRSKCKRNYFRHIKAFP